MSCLSFFSLDKSQHKNRYVSPGQIRVRYVGIETNMSNRVFDTYTKNIDNFGIYLKI